ncbi:MAG: hydrogenase maturation nickel metallochaperone HypA [Thermoguttaceae bacterium]|jgi:hydrogenase nickel incorporation protein HypA/HybF
MHELSIVEALLEQVGRELHRAGQNGRVKRLEVAIGRLSGVHSGSFRFAFELLAPGTIVEGAKLDISEPPAVCCCARCGARREIEELVAECPGCGSPEITIEQGRDLMLQSIELED